MKLFLIALILVLVIRPNVSLAQSFDTEEVVAQLYSDTIKRTGILDFKRTLSLSFKSSGYLSQLNIDEGDRFTKGKLLASLDITELKEIKNSRYAQLLQAKREVERISTLMADKLATIRDMDAALTNVETMRSAYQVSYYNVEKAKIYAPFSGIVLSRSTELGELQNPGKEVLKVAKPEWVVKVSLTGEDVRRVKLKQRVKVLLNQTGAIEGIVTKIPAIANAGNNLFTIEVSLPKIKMGRGMIAGQLAGVEIDFASDNFVYKFPIAALVKVDEQGKAIVLAQPKGAAEFLSLSFEIFQLDSDYIYVIAARDEKPLKIITKGWHNYTLGEQ